MTRIACSRPRLDAREGLVERCATACRCCPRPAPPEGRRPRSPAARRSDEPAGGSGGTCRRAPGPRSRPTASPSPGRRRARRARRARRPCRAPGGAASGRSCTPHRAPRRRPPARRRRAAPATASRVPTTTSTSPRPDPPPLVGALAVAEAASGRAATRASRSARSRSTSGSASAISGTSTRPRRPRSSDGTQGLRVDRRLAAAGDAVEEDGPPVAAVERPRSTASTASACRRVSEAPAGRAPRCVGPRAASGRRGASTHLDLDESPADEAGKGAGAVTGRELGRGRAVDAAERGQVREEGRCRDRADERRRRCASPVASRASRTSARSRPGREQRPVQVDPAAACQRVGGGEGARRGPRPPRAVAPAAGPRPSAASIASSAASSQARGVGGLGIERRRAAAPPRAPAARAARAAASPAGPAPAAQGSARRSRRQAASPSGGSSGPSVRTRATIGLVSTPATSSPGPSTIPSAWRRPNSTSTASPACEVRERGGTA